MILLPKYSDIIVPEQNIVLPRSTMRGRFKLTAIRPDGRERPLTDWFENAILDSGLNGLGTTSQLSHAHVGTSNTAVSTSQTGLQGWLAASNSIQETNDGTQSSAPYYGWKRIRYRFNQGVATGNINEVGIGSASQSSTLLWSRALTVNGGGTPTTITVLADEVLDVTYELRLYPPTVDGSGGPFNIGGSNYNVTWRAAMVTSNAWSQWIGTTATQRPSGAQHTVYSGVMGAITGSPSGTAASTTATDAAYSNNSLQRDATASYGLNDGNVGGSGIKSIRISTSLGAFQFEFDNPVPKDNTKTCTFSHRISWGRYP